jgi:tRNA(Ile)-lysidine synthase TilS/MesJ
MDPGYNEENITRLKENADILNIPLHIFKTNIFQVVSVQTESPCYLCARMRRGHLYSEAKKLGCNKIALGHHFNDVIETILMGIFYGSQFQTMMPKLKSTSHLGMELIRPLYFVREEDIIFWKNKHELEFITCACRLTANKVVKATGESNSKREEMKQLIKKMKEINPNVEKNIYNSTKNVNLTTIISYHKNDGNVIEFLDNY